MAVLVPVIGTEDGRCAVCGWEGRGGAVLRV